MRKRVKLVLYLFLLFGFMKVNAQTKNIPIHTQHKNTNKPILFFLTGDGGWNTFSIQLSDELSKNGYSVVSLDTRKYFWEQKTPAQFGTDMTFVIDHYLKLWEKESFYIVGYSFGAEVAAFLPAHLSAFISEKIKSMVLLSPGYSNSFEVRFINMIAGKNTNKDKYKIYPELLKTTVPTLCIFGSEEQTDISQELKDTNKIRKITIPGSHHYKDDVKAVTSGIIKGLLN